MPPLGEALDDDYVISLLKKDAEANQKRYLSTGLGSLHSSKPRGNAPKPNTRFLKHIIRDVDSHNAALKAKEEEESRVKLAGLRAEKRKRVLEVEEGSEKRRRGHDKPGRWQSVLGRASSGLERRRKTVEQRSERDSEASSREQAVIKHRSRDHKDGRRRSDLEHDRSRHNRRASNRSPTNHTERRRLTRSGSRSPLSADNDNARAKTSADSDSESSNAVLGPKPASRSRPRGRGADRLSAIDSRFDPSYNPKEDVDLEPDEDQDEWDMALEALRDRAKWRSQGADRLRAAGFTDEEIQKWKKGGEKDVTDVHWKGKGEGREWDRGKVADESGRFDVQAEWASSKVPGK